MLHRILEVGVVGRPALNRCERRRVGDFSRHCRDGTRWKPEQTRLAFDWYRELARRTGNGATDSRLRQMLGEATFAAGVESFAQTARIHVVMPDMFDRDPWLLGTPSGAVDLHTGQLHPPNPADYIPKQTLGAPAEPGTECPLFDDLLDFVTSNDHDLRRFLL